MLHHHLDEEESDLFLVEWHWRWQRELRVALLRGGFCMERPLAHSQGDTRQSKNARLVSVLCQGHMRAPPQHVEPILAHGSETSQLG